MDQFLTSIRLFFRMWINFKILLLLSFSVCSLSWAGDDVWATISEIKKDAIPLHIYATEGYVVKIFRCPPCPKKSQCKECMKNNIIVSEKNIVIENYNDVKGTEIIIFTDNIERFKLSKKYKFVVQVLGYKSTGEPINDIDLLSYSNLKE